MRFLHGLGCHPSSRGLADVCDAAHHIAGDDLTDSLDALVRCPNAAHALRQTFVALPRRHVLAPLQVLAQAAQRPVAFLQIARPRAFAFGVNRLGNDVAGFISLCNQAPDVRMRLDRRTALAREAIVICVELGVEDLQVFLQRVEPHGVALILRAHLRRCLLEIGHDPRAGHFLVFSPQPFLRSDDVLDRDVERLSLGSLRDGLTRDLLCRFRIDAGGPGVLLEVQILCRRAHSLK